MDAMTMIWMFAGLMALAAGALVAMASVSVMFVCVVACIRLLEGSAS